MKYWRGYIVAALLAALTAAIMQFAKNYSGLVDMVYPYLTRMVQNVLSVWSAGFDFCLWQLGVILLAVLVIATVVLMILLRWNFVQWLGWVLACASFLFCAHTGIYGLNTYCSPLAEDIRLHVDAPHITELAEATTYFRDRANELSDQVPRNADGSLDYPSFEALADQAGEGFKALTYQHSYSVFAGDTSPVKELGWADMYTSMGIDGVTMPLTGEAAVNPQIPKMAMPFIMCHEMAHRMCISQERDANLAAFLSCRVNSDPIFQYSAYFMAFKYCYNALANDPTTTAAAAAKSIREGLNDLVKADLSAYSAHYNANIDASSSQLATDVNDAYIKISGDQSGTDSYGEVCTLLVSWYIQEIYMPLHQDEGSKFDPLDRNQVDLSSPVGGK